MADVSDAFSLTAALSWFDMLLAALDCYTWVFGEDLLTLTDLFTGMYTPQGAEIERRSNMIKRSG